MEISPLGERATIISFDDPYLTNVGVIFAVNTERVFVLDTFLGSESMGVVQEVIRDRGAQDWPVTVFNSHADYDHVWGNGSFCGSTIVAHHLGKIRMEKESAEALTKYAEHKRGIVKVVPPNLTFTTAISFAREHIRIEHTPGHTPDSASLTDLDGGLLFVGDNVEAPVPYVNTLDFDGFLHSLNGYTKKDWKYLLASHNPIMTDDHLLNANIRYLERLRDWDFDLETASHDEVHVHLHNLASLSSSLLEKPRPQEVMQHYRAAIDYVQSREDLAYEDLLSMIRRVVI